MNGNRFTDLQDAQLYDAIIIGRLALEQAKHRLFELENEVSRRQENVAADVFRAARKEHGSATFTDAHGNKFKAEARRDVKWDSPKLQAIASSMPWPEVERVFDIKFSVPERIYTAMTDMHLRGKIDEARTTKTGELRVIYVGRDVGNGDSA